MSARDVCKKRCCWTPFGTCAKKRACACHASDETRRYIAAAGELGVAVDEIRRREILRELHEKPGYKKTGGGRWTRFD